ncbi:hypothetical protein AAFN60_19250 [Roseibacillus persicicus]|uniref:hypothetical protein n=1 Tax=Roseibacillus persicicus TaxID=454148 RepID=UPI00398A8A46
MNLIQILHWGSELSVLAQAATLDSALETLVETIQKFSAVLCLIMIVVGSVAYSKGDVDRSLHLFGAAALAGTAWLITSFFFDLGEASIPF